MADAHYHCGICDGGDYDLCEACRASGKNCHNEDHWLVKRFVKDGKVVSSTTERLPTNSKPQSKMDTVDEAADKHEAAVKQEVKTEIPGAFMDDAKTLTDAVVMPTRICNCCVITKPESECITCTSCDDYDLCLRCHSKNQHGHHPGHGFTAVVPNLGLSLLQKYLLPAGRNVRHAASCDGCDKAIYGVRHKCFNCPDFDYCSDCFKQARLTHPQHRFAAIYDALPVPSSNSYVRHHGIYCDGPLCTNSEKRPTLWVIVTNALSVTTPTSAPLARLPLFLLTTRRTP